MADPLCSTALNYYNKNCQAMFKGGKCSKRCNNSLDILMRHESAGKLATCFCDGTEEFKCKEIRENTENLCFEKEKDVSNTIDEEEVHESKGIMKKSSLLVVISLICSVLNTSLGESVITLLQDFQFK
jgi:hypothetical protein